MAASMMATAARLAPTAATLPVAAVVRKPVAAVAAHKAFIPTSLDKMPTGMTVVDSAEALSAITDRGCGGTLWDRRIPQEVTDWIAGLRPSQLPNARARVTPDEVEDAVLRMCKRAGTPESPHRDWLVADIKALADRFARLTGAPKLQVRLEAVATNACRKFHVDSIIMRLICTYRGPATQLGTSPDMNRAQPKTYANAALGAPLILRGLLWPESPRSGLLHRSPPIEGTGITRLLFVIDPIMEDCDCDSCNEEEVHAH